MRNLSILLIVCICSLQNIKAQKSPKSKASFEFSLQEETTIRLKKMTLTLDLTSSQQKEMLPLISEMITHKRKALKEREKSEKKTNKAQAFAKINQHLDFKIAMKKKIKEVLNSKQYEMFSENMMKEKSKKKKYHKQRTSKMS
ncbi:MAG: hypothetical protein ACPHXR_02075 [Flavicella sp.]